MWILFGVLSLLAMLAFSGGWWRDAERQVLRQVSRMIITSTWLGGLVALLIGLSACNQKLERAAAAMTGGEPGRGKAVLQQYGCGACHTIPGIRGANTLVGPSLAQMASRMYIAGVLPNTPENMLRWLQNPPAVDALTAMPNLGVTETDARDMAGYLYTLR
jgi:cytochrome c